MGFLSGGFGAARLTRTLAAQQWLSLSLNEGQPEGRGWRSRAQLGDAERGISTLSHPPRAGGSSVRVVTANWVGVDCGESVGETGRGFRRAREIQKPSNNFFIMGVFLLLRFETSKNIFTFVWRLPKIMKIYLRSLDAYLRSFDACLKWFKIYLRSLDAYLRSFDACFKRWKIYLRSLDAYLRSFDTCLKRWEI